MKSRPVGSPDGVRLTAWENCHGHCITDWSGMQVEKPKQTMQFEKNPDNDTLLEELESAMFSITEAMESLRGYKQFSDWFDTLDGMFDEMEPEREQYEIQAGIEYNREIGGLTRQYWRDAI